MSKSRLATAYLFIFCAFILLFARYGYLQLVDHNILLQQSVNNYSSITATAPARGEILDKNGTVLANNKASYVVAILPKDLKKNSALLLQNLAKYITISALDKKKFMAQLLHAKNYDWVIIKDDLSDSEIATLTAHSYEFPQIAVFARTKRFYPYADIYSHSIGYVGRISQSDKITLDKKNQSQNYLANDYIGKSGLEEFYETKLRGHLGKKIIKTDAHGNEISFIANTPGSDGDTIQLTIDNNLQNLAWNLLGDNRGAIVAIDPQTGGVLAFVSKPGYNPNWFIDGIDFDDWKDLATNPNKPLLNRAADGTYPPGSTFKPFMAIAALFLGVRTPNSTFNDLGYYVIPGSTHRFRDSHKGGRGVINFTQAIYYSSDTYFYKLGMDMGIDKADKVLTLFGFGQKTGIDLLKDNPGLLPSKAWKTKYFNKKPAEKTWLASDNVTFAVGQGFNHYTPLQMAFATTIIANDGIVIAPHFLDRVLDKNGNTIESYVVTKKQLKIPAADFIFVKQAMQKVITMGTARGISSGLEYTMAGKTGTAQVVGMNSNNRQAKFSGKQYKDHAWFIAFAPVDNPKIAIAVVVENGGWGASAAAPIARKLFDFYLLNNSKLMSRTTVIPDINTNHIKRESGTH